MDPFSGKYVQLFWINPYLCGAPAYAQREGRRR